MRWSIFLVTVLMLFVLGACTTTTTDDDDDADIDATPTEEESTPTIEPAPTETPEPEPTETPEPEPSETPEPEPTATTEPEPTEEPANGEGTEHRIEMTDANTFSPDELTISVGDTVTWVNVSSTPHTTTADPEIAREEDSASLPDGAETWDSETMEEGDEFSYTFEVPGEYTYFCIPHEVIDMIGHITVEE